MGLYGYQANFRRKNLRETDQFSIALGKLQRFVIDLFWLLSISGEYDRMSGSLVRCENDCSSSWFSESRPAFFSNLAGNRIEGLRGIRWRTSDCFGREMMSAEFDLKTEKNLDYVLAGLMRRYRERVPDVERVIEALVADGLVSSGESIENDHIAFRTMGVPHLGIASFEKIFLHYGYQRRDPYFFESKKLDAFWYAPPKPHFPRIFISELRVGDLSTEAQAIIRSYTDQVTADPVDQLDLDDAAAVDQYLHTPLWRTPTLADYQRLEQESEYAAWVIYNRYYLNHFTVSVHNLPQYNTIDQFNVYLEQRGFKLNDSGGKAKKSPDGLLNQSSTVAEMVNAEFSDGAGGIVHRMISGSYVEFAERKVLPQFVDLPPLQITRQHRRDGFEAQNADRIFESTYSTQTGR
jgi:hypothetical protein